jgi:hypothetical protein
MTLRNRIRSLLLHGKSPVHREVRNTAWNADTSVVLLYLDKDEDRYREVRRIAQQIKTLHGIKRVVRVAYIDREEKAVPPWQLRKLDSDYCCMGDFTWWGSVTRHAAEFAGEAFDVLIDCESDAALEARLPLDVLVHASTARMKLGTAGSVARPQDFDVVFERGMRTGWSEHIDRMIAFLTNRNLEA